jgi:hypothetical protein
MVARLETMMLTLEDRERIADSALKIQSVKRSLDRVDEKKLPLREELIECLKKIDNSLRTALGYGPQSRPRK